MLENIQNVLNSIAEFFAGVVDFVVGFVGDLVGFVKQLGSMGSQLTQIMGGMPIYFIAGIGSLVVIMVLLRVLGRD